MAGIVGALIASAIASGVASLGSSLIGNAFNYFTQNDINQRNVKATLEANQANIDYSREYAQNGIQWKADDLEAAGLNPVLAAGGAFGGTPSSPTVQAPQQKAPMLDFTGVSNAVQALNNTMQTLAILDSKKSISDDRNEVLNGLYQRKASFFNDSSKYSGYVGNAKQIADKTVSDKEWDKLLKDLDSIPYKYNWKK